MKDCTSDFFVLYANDDIVNTQFAVSEICDRLSITYDLWSYETISESNNDIDTFIEQKIEETPFVVAFFTAETLDSPSYVRFLKYALDGNKTIIPVTFDGGWVLKFKRNIDFRKKILSYKVEEDKIVFFEEIHALLGLPKVGNVYGSKLTLNVENGGLEYDVVVDGCKVYAEHSVDTTCDIVLSKGSHKILFYSNNNVWAEYLCEIETNDSSYSDSVSLLCDYNLSLSQFDDIEDIFSVDFENEAVFAKALGYTGSERVVLVDSSHKEMKVKLIESYYYKQYNLCLQLEPVWNHLSIKFPSKWYTLIAYPFLFFVLESIWHALFVQVLILLVYWGLEVVVCFFINNIDKARQTLKIQRVKSHNTERYRYYKKKCIRMLDLLHAEDFIDLYGSPMDSKDLLNKNNSNEDHVFFINIYD